MVQLRFSKGLRGGVMVLKILHIVLLASVKYIVTLPYAMMIGVEYKYAILAVWTGGIGGFLFFYYLSTPLNRGLNIVWPCLCRMVPKIYRERYRLYCERRKNRPKKKNFSKKKRFIVRLKTSYGLWGVIIATPVILTIPLGAFLANKYYREQKHIVFYMIISIIVWGLVLSGLVHLFPNVFLQ